MRLLAIALMLIALCAPLGARSDDSVDCKVKTRFSSEGEMGSAIIDALGAARKRILAALYGFNNLVLADKLIESAKRGVSVSIKLDAGKGATKKSAAIINDLKAVGVEVRNVASEGRNHNKFVVIDDVLVITGSYNWTVKAERNWENLLFLNCPAIAARYTREWEKIH